MEATEIKVLKRNALKNSLIIAFLYVGLSTITVVSVYPKSALYGDWIYFGLLLTLPISLIGFAVMFADPDMQDIVLIIQAFLFLLTWFTLYRELLKRSRAQRDSI